MARRPLAGNGERVEPVGTGFLKALQTGQEADACGIGRGVEVTCEDGWDDIGVGQIGEPAIERDALVLALDLEPGLPRHGHRGAEPQLVLTNADSRGGSWSSMAEVGRAPLLDGVSRGDGDTRLPVPLAPLVGDFVAQSFEQLVRLAALAWTGLDLLESDQVRPERGQLAAQQRLALGIRPRPGPKIQRQHPHLITVARGLTSLNPDSLELAARRRMASTVRAPIAGSAIVGNVRRRRKSFGLSVHAISGTYVVMLGISLPASDCEGLRGFAIHRTDHTEHEAYYLRGLKTFAATDPGFPPGSTYSTRDHPIQGFGWSDYTAKPGHRYTYRVEALTGLPESLTVANEVEVTIGTESPDGATHAVYFNRGVAASQAYARRFGNRRPDEVGEPAFEWLSRGLAEAIVGFIEAAHPGDGLRVAAYEFDSEPVLGALKAAVDRGVDVRIVYDARRSKPGERNAAAVAEAGLTAVATARATHAYISHNKFIVRMRGGAPEAVLTGGANFSDGGIYGHSNVAHVVEDGAVTEQFRVYWDLLATDPTNAVLKPQVTDLALVPTGYPSEGTSAIFSPRSSTDALEFYARMARQANDSLFITFAFGMHPLFQDVYRTSTARIRYAILEKKTRPMAPGTARDAEESAIDALRSKPANLFAIGSKLTHDRFDRWLEEKDSRLNRNVKYIHNKFMLIDPLSSSPIVVAGSANFSKASSDTNDENMLVIRGNRRVADVYLGEFMRLYAHHAFRGYVERAGATVSTATPQHLSLGDWWRDYFGGSSRARQRRLFAAVSD